MHSLQLDIIRRVYGRQIFFKKKHQHGLAIPINRTMARYYKYRGRPLA